MNNFRKFVFTVSIGLLALICEFVFKQPTLAYWIVGVMGGILALNMFVGMIKTLKSGKYGVDILAITAIVATLAVGEYWASLMVLIMLTGGDSLEDYASRQAHKELQSLLDNSPQIAHRKLADKTEDITLDSVAINDILVVRPGEIVPVDGVIIEGSSSVDESSLTGEAKPVTKEVGQELMSGSINGDAALIYQVTKEASDSQYQRIIELVKSSEQDPANFVRLADRYAVPFTIAAYLIGGIAWYITKDPVRFAEVLVVASPCPLILAAPIALVAGMSRSSRNGIVVKTGTTIEKLSKVQSIAFDKTGTITQGRLQVEKITPLVDMEEKEFIRLAASAEQASAHILARSLTAYAKDEHLALYPVTDLKEITGSGISAVVENHTITVGKASLVGAQVGPSYTTTIYVAIDNKYAGFITFTDTMRPEAPATMTQLKTLGVNRLVMLTGDQSTIANQIAQEAGITEVHANCLPTDKIEVLKSIPNDQRPVMMVGDGINDAPALTIADIGIAMGAHGSSAASESADAVILKDDLSRVSAAVSIAQDTMNIAKQSVLLGIIICLILMIIASFGYIPALLGAIFQELVDTVAIISALRARKD